MSMKQYLKRISILGFSRAGVIFLGSFLGLLLLLLAHLLPIRPIMNHLGQSSELI